MVWIWFVEQTQRNYSVNCSHFTTVWVEPFAKRNVVYSLYSNLWKREPSLTRICKWYSKQTANTNPDVPHCRKLISFAGSQFGLIVVRDEAPSNEKARIFRGYWPINCKELQEMGDWNRSSRGTHVSGSEFSTQICVEYPNHCAQILHW